MTPIQVFREVGAAVDSVAAWARYMALGGGAGDAARVVALQYVQGEGPGRDPEGWGACEGPAAPAGGAQLLSVDVASASTGAFGDDLAIECLATAYGRDIYVVRRGQAQADMACRQEVRRMRHYIFSHGAADLRPLWVWASSHGASAGSTSRMHRTSAVQRRHMPRNWQAKLQEQLHVLWSGLPALHVLHCCAHTMPHLTSGKEARVLGWRMQCSGCPDAHPAEPCSCPVYKNVALHVVVRASLWSWHRSRRTAKMRARAQAASCSSCRTGRWVASPRRVPRRCSC